MNNEFNHLIYPISIALAMSILLDSLGGIEWAYTQARAYSLGILVMYASWLIVYLVFLRKHGK